MISHRAARLSLRAKWLTLSVCTTGSISLAATATGYTRAQATGTVSATSGVATFSTSQAGVIANGGAITVAGSVYTVSAFNGTTGCTLSGSPTFGASAFTVSFIADGAAVGMEILAAGFSTAANNGTGVITALTATTMTVSAYTVTAGSAGYTVASRTLVVEAAQSGRTISVGLPVMRAWENVDFKPSAGVPYVVEQYVPGPAKRISMGANAEMEWLPMFAPQVHVEANRSVGAADAYADAMLQHFAPGTQLTLANSTFRVRGDTAPYSGQLLQSSPGFAVTPVNVPLVLRTTNVI